MKKIVVRWSVNDGTLRPKSHFIDVLKLSAVSHEAWLLMSKEEKSELINDLVQSAFEENVQWQIDNIEEENV